MHPYIQAIVQSEPGHYFLALGFSALITGGAFWYFLRALRHSHHIANTPTSRIRSAAQGFVELEGWGRLLAGESIISPLTLVRCVWWKYSVEEKRTVNRNGRRQSEWVTIESGTSSAIFELYDDTGSCIIDPDGAEVIPGKRQRWYGNSHRPDRGPKNGLWSMFGRFRYTEELLLPEKDLYALGLFRTQRAAYGGHFDESAELSALLNEWKRDQAKLLQRFDVNRDGKLDLKEWEAARRVALVHLRRNQLELDTQPGLNVLGKPSDGSPFILSSVPQDQLLKKKQRSVLLCALVSVAGFAFTALLIVARHLVNAAP